MTENEKFIEDAEVEFLGTNPDLIFEIKKDLDNFHLKDDREKLATFFTTLTGYLEPAELHKTMNILGDTSTGKDNLIKSVFLLFPGEDVLFLTGATAPALEDDIDQYKIIAFSELNLTKEFGANKNLIETLKQMTEGGTSTLKKDVNTGFKKTKRTIQEQKAVLWATTETEKDAELDTRGMCITLLPHPKKQKAVNDMNLNKFSNPDYILKSNLEEDNRIVKLIRYLRYNGTPYGACPCFNLIKNIFDPNDPRSQRDVKRFVAIVLSIAWIHQLQREKKTIQLFKGKTKNKIGLLEPYYKEQDVFVAEPIDIIRAVEIYSPYLNQTYKGIDQRLQNIVDVIKKSGEISRNDLQKELGIKSVNTIKEYTNILIDKGFAEYVYENDELKRENNSPMIKSLSNAYQMPIISLSTEELKLYLLKQMSKSNDRLLTGYRQAINNLKPLEIEDLGDIGDFVYEPVNILNNDVEEVV